MSSQSRVAVIVVTHPDYTPKYLMECYAALRAQTYPSSCFATFIVSNGITTDGLGEVRRIAEDARLLQSSTNLGWAGGNNAAIKVALREDFDYLVMLNVDTVVARDWLASLVSAADEREDIDILQSKIFLYGTDRLNSIGTRMHYLGYGSCIGYEEKLPGRDGCMKGDCVSGASMLVKRRVFERIGLFREEYFMYYDDVEFCWRARLAGFRLGLADRSICNHKYSFGGKGDWLFNLERNRLLTLVAMEKFRTLFIIAPCFLLAELVVTVYFIGSGRGATPWRLLWYFLRRDTWRSIRTHRRKVQALRRRKDAEIVRGFSGALVFPQARNPLLRYVLNPLLAGYWIVAKRLIVW